MRFEADRTILEEAGRRGEKRTYIEKVWRAGVRERERRERNGAGMKEDADGAAGGECV